MREKCGTCHADLRAGGDHQPFGFGNARAALEQVRGMSGRNCQRLEPERRLGQREFRRGLSHQDRERVLELRSLALCALIAGLRGLEQGPCFRDVEAARRSARVANFRKLQSSL